MRLKIATTLLISVFGISYAGNFIAFIDKESKIASKTNTKQEYSEWGNIDEPYECTEWTPSADTIELETSFEQSRECLQDQERSLSTYNVYSNGVEKIAQSSIENQTVSITDTQNALGTMPMDPWAKQVKIMASDAQASDQFGGSVSISGDTAVVGASREDTGGVYAGAAYIFTP
ncbi:FG-GAP repeat protein [Vibrio cholerae]